MRRRKLKDSMRNGKKRTHAETAAGWTGSSACLLVPLPPLFIRYRGRLDIPATDDSALSALDTDAQADTFNSLLIPWLLLLPPWRVAPAAAPTIHLPCISNTRLVYDSKRDE